VNIYLKIKILKQQKKINWLSEDCPLVEIHLVEFDHLLKVKKVEEDMKFEDCLNEKTRFETICYGDPLIRNCSEGNIF